MLYERTLNSFLEGDEKQPMFRTDRGDVAMKEAISFTRQRIAAAFPTPKVPARRKVG